MRKTEIGRTLIPAEEREMQEQASSSRTVDEVDDDDDEKFDKEFWLKVYKKVKQFDVSWNRAMDEVRADRLIEKHGDRTLLVIIKDWPQKNKYKDRPELLPSLGHLISRLAEIILRRDTKKHYGSFHVPSQDDPFEPTLLHLAAVQNFLHVSKCLVERYPELMYSFTENYNNERSYLPVELALKEHKDDTAAYLISQMKTDRIQKLFLCKPDNEQSPADFYFGEIISYRDKKTREPGMKKTVVAVLDKMINPRWPHLPERKDSAEDDDEIERVLDSIPDDPMNYDFFYHILEADESGREPKIEADVIDEHGKLISSTKIANQEFNLRSVSCLRRIAESGNKEAVQHPVVRMLVAKKWNEFGRKWYRAHAVVYVFFLSVFSFALLYGSTRNDPTQYSSSADRFRLFCEICCIILIMAYFIEEISEASREGSAYISNPYNYFDWIGILLTILIIPLRLAESRAQWSVASLAYLFNFLKLFKFSNVTRTTGLYTKTLGRIVLRDISRFMIVFLVIFLGFCGAMFMALKVDNSQYYFGHYGWLMLAGFRALAEQQPLAEDYQKFGWLSIVILLVYMAMVIVILLNILIAQLSYTYSEAKKTARIEYAVDTMYIVTRLEFSRLARWNSRVKHYIDGDWISDEDLAKEILEYTEERHPWETVEERLTSVRETMRKVVRKSKETEPWEAVDEKLTRLTAMLKEMSESK